jgi:prophage regulatory protein
MRTREVQLEMNDELASNKLLRLPEVLALVPVSRSSWLAGCKNGHYPPGFLLSPRTRVWKRGEILEVLSRGSRSENSQQPEVANGKVGVH